MSDVRYDTILISLDELLDTRLATIALINPEYAKHLLWHGWDERIMDHWPGIDMDTYHDAYERRDHLTLSLAKVTRIPILLRDYAARVIAKGVGKPWEFKPRVCINTWPYKLSEAETELIIRHVVYLTVKSMDVYAVSYSPDELTPKRALGEFNTMVMYDYRWLERHTEDLKKQPIPGVTLLAPMLFQQHVEILPTEDPFAPISKMASSLIRLDWLEPKMLSAAINVVTKIPA